MSRAAVLVIAVVLAASTPAPVLGASWSKPEVVFGAANYCSSVAAAIDAAGRYHLAASCDESIRYAVSDGDGQWTTRVFSHGYDELDLYPQVATDGKFVYVAYTREVFSGDGDCNPEQPSEGVYYRRRSLPDGSWSANRRIGSPGDYLGSFDVSGGVIHATNSSTVYAISDDSTWNHSYEIRAGGVVNRYPIPGANGTSLRIGSDGRARIAYPLAGSIRYGLFNGSGFWRTRVTGSSKGSGPTLALGKGDRAYLLWTRHDPGSCHQDEEPVPSTEDGTYFATNASGTWVSRRLTTDFGFGAKSLTVDLSTGRVHALLAGYLALTYFTRSPAGRWSHTDLGPGYVLSPVIRQDPTTGALLVVYISDGRVNVLTKS